MTARRLTGFLLAIAGAAGFTACLKSLVAGMEDVIKVDGGSCASGGPYVVAHQCSGADIRLIMVGIFGGLVAAAVYAGGTSALGRPGSSAGLLIWTALFGLLGWNFISTGLHPPTGQGTLSGLLFTGAMFLLMALGGLIVLLVSVTGDLRSAGRPGPAITGMQPLVQAAVVPGFPGLQTGAGGAWQPGGAVLPDSVASPAARGGELLRAGIWLLASVAGAGLGIVLSSTLIALLH
jgi:hypothetical protein